MGTHIRSRDTYKEWGHRRSWDIHGKRIKDLYGEEIHMESGHTRSKDIHKKMIWNLHKKGIHMKWGHIRGVRTHMGSRDKHREWRHT